MRIVPKLAVAALLVASAMTLASAQVSKRTPRALAPANSVSDPYGERPRDPNASVPCSERPFAIGCDKRGFW